ncbi:MAG: lipopolysaccharide biosynthesis protein, partial [Cyanobacteriota bacterium]
MALKRNLIANVLGQGWAGLMSVAFIPLYIKFLGIEAYGLIGIFAMLQAWLSLLDMGMTPTLSREMARFTAGERSRQSIHDLLRSIELIAMAVAATVTACMALASNWIAHSWLNIDGMPTAMVTQAISAMGLVIGLRFLEGIYRSSLVGLQQQVLFNSINCVTATLRGLGTVGILSWVSPSIQAFFLWQGLISILMVLTLRGANYANLPHADHPARFSVGALRSVWGFAGGMMGITILALLLTQVDKIFLSKLLPLQQFGYYPLASTAAGA